MAWAVAREATAELARAPDDPAASIDVALFWSYAADGFADDGAIGERYEQAVDTLFDRFSSQAPMPWLFGGSIGQAWVIAHISDDTAALDAFDAAARAALADAAAPPGPYDLISGVVGIGAYFLERARQGSDQAAGLDLVVTTLADRAERRADGVTWFTPAELLPPWIREICPAGHHDLGVAHGVPGAIAVLAAIAAHEEVAGRAVARELAVRALDWLQHQQVDDDPRGRYPTWIAPGHRAKTRTAWCYGDPGVAASCWRAAADLGRDPLPWQTLAAAAASRSIEHTGIVDPNLCHGAAGLAHLCNRFYQATREPQFRDAARRWFEHAIAMRPSAHEMSSDFLDGTAGVVLALLAALRAEEPGWDRLLLCDVPVIAAVAGAGRYVRVS